MLKLKTILTVILMLFLLTPITALAQEPDESGIKSDCAEGSLCLNTPIGGVKEVSIFGEYFALWYKFVVGVVGVLATVIIMWGGFKWLTSRGNSAAISDAKDRIWSSIIGLILVFLSYNILSLINPKLLTIGLPTLKTVTPIVNTDNNLDNDRDVVDQLLRSIADLSYTYTPLISPELEAGYVAMENAIEWLIAEDDQEALESYLASHNVNVVDSTNLLQANTQDLIAISRVGNTFGEIDVSYENGRFILDPSQANLVTSLMSRDGVANGENGNNFSTNIIDAGSYQITRITDLNFDYVDSNGSVHNYELSATGNRNNDGNWELIFQR
jgi:hypothetical protein